MAAELINGPLPSPRFGPKFKSRLAFRKFVITWFVNGFKSEDASEVLLVVFKCFLLCFDDKKSFPCCSCSFRDLRLAVLDFELDLYLSCRRSRFVTKRTHQGQIQNVSATFGKCHWDEFVMPPFRKHQMSQHSA